MDDPHHDPYGRWRFTMFVLSVVFAVVAIVLVFVAGAVLGGST